MIRLDVEKRRIELLVDEAELKKRHAAMAAREDAGLGQARLRLAVQRDHFAADEGCDFDFMREHGKG